MKRQIQQWGCCAAALLMFAACGQKENKTEAVAQECKPYTIDLSEVEFTDEPQPLSLFVESIEYIKLDEEPLLPDIYQTHMFVDKERNIYVNCLRQGFYKFNPQGQFVKSLIRKGQGPGEVAQRIGRLAFNGERGYVLVDDYGRYQDRHKISLDGEHLGYEQKLFGKATKHPFEFWKDTELYFFNRGGYYERHSMINIDSLYFFTVRDINTDSIVFRLKNHHFDVKGERIGPRISRDSEPADRGVIGDSLFWIRPLKLDTVFCTTDWTDVRPLYIIKQSNDAADYEWLVKLDAGIDNLNRSEVLNKKRLEGLHALKNGVLYYYYRSQDEMGIGYCPANGKSIAFTKYFKNDVDEFCPPLNFENLIYQNKLVEKDGYLWLLVDAFRFFEDGAKSPFPDLDEESNPVLVKLKLKK